MNPFHQFSLSLLLLTFSFNSLFAQTNLEIWEVQGTGNTSPFVGESVTLTNNIVTVVTNDRFFLQSTSQNTDNNQSTSDGILVEVGNSPNVQIGDIVNVEGFVQEFDDETQIIANSLNVVVISSNATLPAPIVFDDNFPGKIPNTIHDLETVEGMSVELQDAFITAATSQFDFLTVSASGERPFREPGIEWPGIAGLPVWDGNPEVFDFDLFFQNIPILAAGSRVSASGVITQGFFGYEFTATNATFEPNNTTISARERNTDEISFGCINGLFLDTDFNRVRKMTDYIVDMMKTPDVIAFQEIQNINVLENIATRINAENPDIEYSAHLVGGSAINLGFLVRNTLINVATNPLGTTEVISTNGFTLHDRPPFLLTADINTPTPTPISLLNVHLRSLNGITGNDAEFVRTKRHEQAVSVSNMVEARQDDNLFVMGDFNAFHFSDGYVDVVNQIQGTPSVGAEFSTVPVDYDPLVNLTTEFVPDDQQYSFIFGGNSQILDHCLAVPNLDGLTVNEVIYIRNNADFHSEFLEDFSTPLRVSDHDGFVVYLQLSDTVTAIEPEPPFTGENLVFSNPLRNSDNLKLSLLQPGFITVKLYGTDGRLVLERNYGFAQPGQLELATQFNVASGVYFMEVESTGFLETGKLVILNE